MPKDNISLPKHVEVVYLLFICIWYCALGWYNKRIRRSQRHGMDSFKFGKSIKILSI